MSDERRHRKTRKAVEREALRDAVVVTLVFAASVTISGLLAILLLWPFGR